jgi:hypothetical protein
LYFHLITAIMFIVVLGRMLGAEGLISVIEVFFVIFAT